MTLLLRNPLRHPTNRRRIDATLFSGAFTPLPARFNRLYIRDCLSAARLPAYRVGSNHPSLLRGTCLVACARSRRRRRPSARFSVKLFPAPSSVVCVRIFSDWCLPIEALCLQLVSVLPRGHIHWRIRESSSRLGVVFCLHLSRRGSGSDHSLLVHPHVTAEKLNTYTLGRCPLARLRSLGRDPDLCCRVSHATRWSVQPWCLGEPTRHLSFWLVTGKEANQFASLRSFTAHP